MSPKNKGKFGRGKEQEIPVEDEFVSGFQRLGHKLAPHARRLVALLTGVLIAVFALVGYQHYQRGRDAQATDLILEAFDLAGRPLYEDETERELLGENTPHFASEEARTTAILAVVEKLDNQFRDTPVAHSARLFHAGILLDADRYDDAVALYQKIAASEGISEFEALTAREGKGYALEAKGMAAEGEARKAALESALAAFAAMQPNPDGDGADRALFHQARVLQALGRTEEAVAKYKEVLERTPGTPFRSDIDNRLAALE